tara:strand:+ start:203 stop:490 length:288 start_codon:yes stop_codon:yes gene_type:complete
MLQKIVNGIAIASGVISLSVVGLGGYVFIRKDAIIEDVKSKIMESVMPGGMSGILGGDAGGGALGGLGDLVNPAPASPTPDAPAAAPKSPIPLGF